MCAQAVVLSHEMTNPEYSDSYLARVLQPLVPVIVWGRSYKACDEPEERATIYDFYKVYPQEYANNYWSLFGLGPGG